jgi:hypothetical protein
MNANTINAQADAIVHKILNDNIKTAYHMGYLDGAKQILLHVSDNLKKAALAKDCPDNVKVGLNEAFTYIKSVIDNKPYVLTNSEEK